MDRRFKVLVCRGPECGDRRGSRELYDRFRQVIEDRGIGERVELGWQSCFGRCSAGPNCLVRELQPRPEAQRFLFAALPAKRGLTALYNGVQVADVADIADQHILGGQIVRRLIRRPTVATPADPRSSEKSE